MKRRRKSQAALEFLTTYGWAFIVILATISAMTYFGVIDPTKFIPDRCILGTDFDCKDYRLAIQTSNSRQIADFILVNSVGDTIDVVSVNCTFPNGNSGWATLSDGSLPLNWSSGMSVNLECYAGEGLTNPNQYVGGLVKKEKQRVNIELVYTHGTGGFPHMSDGEIFSTVQEIP